MKIEIIFLKSDQTLTDFSIYVNNNHCGHLCMKTDEAGSFHQILAHGCAKKMDTFISSGTIHHAPEKPKEP